MKQAYISLFVAGVMGRLKQFVHLGVNMIAISPIFKTAGDELQYTVMILLISVN